MSDQNNQQTNFRKLEVNFSRLLQKCEQLAAKETLSSEEMRDFTKYAEVLRNQLRELRKSDRVGNFSERLENLKTVHRRGRRTSFKQSENKIPNQVEEEINEDTFQELITSNTRRHEIVTDHMVELARALKENSQHMSSIVVKDIKAIETLSEVADGNLVKLKSENNSLKLHRQSISSWTLTYCIVLFLVAMIFMGTYLFMKITPKPQN
jgi:hypothetical protein